MMANARPTRCCGARSESVVIIRPLLPSESVITARASRNIQTLPAAMAMRPATTCATNERRMMGWRA